MTPATIATPARTQRDTRRRDDDRRERSERGAAARLAAAAGLAALLAGCHPAHYALDADAEVNAILEGASQTTLAGRREQVLYPDAPAEPAPEAAEVAPVEPVLDPVPEPGAAALALDLESSLALAVTSGREFLTAREDVYLSGLDYSLTRFLFGPILSGTLSALYGDAERGAYTTDVLGTFGLSRILPSGGTFGFDASLLSSDDEDLEQRWTSRTAFSLEQPLLRGAGRAVSHEPLTQAQRDVVYSLRDFELFRQDFSIAIAQDFLAILSQKQTLRNIRERYEQAVENREQSEALRRVERNTYEDLFLARRDEINRENDLLVARTNYERAVDVFKIRLGLPIPTQVAIVDEEVEYEPVRLDADSAVRVALANRLDLLTAQGRVEDAERRVRVAANALLPDLDLDLEYGLSESRSRLSTAGPDEWELLAGLSLELPLNRQAERNAYRAALIDLDRERRDLALLRDQIEREILNQLRTLSQTELQIALARDRIEKDRRAVAVTRIRYEAGDAENRDLIDARQSLTDGENDLIALLNQHFIQRLTLMRDLGVLFIDDRGMWRL